MSKDILLTNKNKMEGFRNQAGDINKLRNTYIHNNNIQVKKQQKKK